MAMKTTTKGCLIVLGLLALIIVPFWISKIISPDAQLIPTETNTQWNIRHGEVAIGMTAEMCIRAKGKPTDINRTTTANGVHEQWCYGEHCKPALYFDNGILTAIQD